MSTPQSVAEIIARNVAFFERATEARRRPAANPHPIVRR